MRTTKFTPDTGSRAKSEQAFNKTKGEIEELEEIPTNENGRPLVKISFAASELIPTGNYANVSIGPCQITAWIDPERVIPDEEGSSYFSLEERATIELAANELADLVERDVVGAQRQLVLDDLLKED